LPNYPLCCVLVGTGMQDEESIGTHRVRVDGDTVLTRYVGVPELDHVKEIHLRFERTLAEHGRLFVINDMRRTGIPSTETRHFIARWGQEHPVAGVVNFGASLPIRMLQGLVIRAASLLGKKIPVVPVNLTTEAEALAWVDARRRSAR